MKKYLMILHFSLQNITGPDAGLHGKLLYDCVLQGLGTTEFTNLIGWKSILKSGQDFSCHAIWKPNVSSSSGPSPRPLVGSRHVQKIVEDKALGTRLLLISSPGFSGSSATYRWPRSPRTLGSRLLWNRWGRPPYLAKNIELITKR